MAHKGLNLKPDLECRRPDTRIIGLYGSFKLASQNPKCSGICVGFQMKMKKVLLQFISFSRFFQNSKTSKNLKKLISFKIILDATRKYTFGVIPT